MLQSKLFPKTKKEAPKEAESINHKLLVRAGFIDQLMAGSWTLLPLGWRVIAKIENIIREEMNAIHGEEMLMPLLHPKEVWNETGRWDKAHEIMYKLKDVNGKEYALSFTHEEIMMDLLRKNVQSYADLPISLYHFSTKFRHELRAKSGILRGREFLMKDLYSAHTSEEDLMGYYEKVKNAYSKIFTRLHLNFKIAGASGGVFTDRVTNEFQVIADSGEDTIYYCDKCKWCANEEVFKGKVGDKCPECTKGKLLKGNSIEVGHIFSLGPQYAEKMNFYFVDRDGKRKPVWFGSYGIGVTRMLGVLVEVSHDEKGILWSKEVAPYQVHLIELPRAKNVKKIYETLQKSGIEVLWDDREVGAGEKFADSDLIGIPVRIVVSEKTGSKVEWKERKKDRKSVV